MVAHDTRSNQDSAPVSVAFTILEPWWKRGWFLGLAALGCAGLLLIARYYTVHRLVVRQRELERLVASRTEELEREKTELLKARSELIETSRRDALTGLLNRGAIFDYVNSQLELAAHSGAPLAIAMADLDSFKSINDRYGHVVGDTVLRECAARVRKSVRPGDAVGRYGGEELLIVLPGLNPASATARMEQLRIAIAGEPIIHQDLALTVTCSFGIAWAGLEASPIESLVSIADGALYRAKKNGRNRVEYAYPDGEGVMTHA